jgi:LmbE family N-acetylglucosaminyl deacetylase
MYWRAAAIDSMRSSCWIVVVMGCSGEGVDRRSFDYPRPIALAIPCRIGGVQPVPALFIQPHYDDVALSCGGTVAAFAKAGADPVTITVFASEIVDEMVGEFAAWKHSRWKMDDPDEVQRVRREEDSRAAAILGSRLRWLGMPDAIYRGDRYEVDDELYGRLHHEEQALANFLAHELTGLPEWRAGNRVFVPLAIGSHVDHQLVYEAGRCLAGQGVEVFAYEDLPYGIHSPGAAADRIAATRRHVGPLVEVPIADTEETKLDAVACYGSQLPVLFRFTGDWRQAMREHARRGSPGGAAVERVWRILPPTAFGKSC